MNDQRDIIVRLFACEQKLLASGVDLGLIFQELEFRAPLSQ
jgi:hypothetical protein